jgi:TPP-dependent pyruvate/acetoin dehydrogenase alpha subunit
MTDVASTGSDLPATPGASKDDTREWLDTMVLIREFEEALDPLAIGGKIPGGVHVAVGQEAVAVGSSRALAANDVVTTSHRPHHHALARGMNPAAIMAELFGRQSGVSGGRGGTMHLADAARGYLPGNGIVGANVGIAMGAALAAHLRGVDQVACAFFGDGAVNTGRTWESLNLAAAWKLPLIAVCENNLYAVETLITDVSGGESFTARASSFGLCSMTIDGQDAYAVFEAVRAARMRAIAHAGPTFIEALTYRYHGHSTGDDQAYRDHTEVEQWKLDKDPIERLRRRLEEDGSLQSNEFDQIVVEAKRVVEDAVAFAEASPFPDPESVADAVYGQQYPGVVDDG